MLGVLVTELSYGNSNNDILTSKHPDENGFIYSSVIFVKESIIVFLFPEHKI